MNELPGKSQKKSIAGFIGQKLIKNGWCFRKHRQRSIQNCKSWNGNFKR